MIRKIIKWTVITAMALILVPVLILAAIIPVSSLLKAPYLRAFFVSGNQKVIKKVIRHMFD